MESGLEGAHQGQLSTDLYSWGVQIAEDKCWPSAEGRIKGKHVEDGVGDHKEQALGLGGRLG